MSVSPPRPNGPHLNALRAFEAAARLGGFTKAAEELNVTPGAISQHIKAIEAWAGVELFERRTQGVVLTVLGQQVVENFTAAFDSLGDAVRSLKTNATNKTINIAALPSVAQLWLSPRLPAIRKHYNTHKFSVIALESPPNLLREMFDLSIFLEHPTNKENTKVIRQDVIFPVCTPEMALRLNHPHDLNSETLIFDARWYDDWAVWYNSSCPDLKYINDHGPVFSLYSIAVEEAKNGAGVLMGHECLIKQHLENGSLVAPFKHKAQTGKALIIETPYNVDRTGDLDQIIKQLSK